MNQPRRQGPIKAFRARREKRREAAELDLAMKRQTIAARDELMKTLASLSVPPRALSPDLYNAIENGVWANGGAVNNGWWSKGTSLLRRASRIAYWESSHGRAIVNRLSDTVVGGLFDLQSLPAWDVIDNPRYADPQARKAWTSKMEARFRLWAKQAIVDYRGEKNFYQISWQLFHYLLKDGEYFVVLRYAPTRNRNPLSIQIIPPENVTGGTIPDAYVNTNKLIDGIEYDQWDCAVAYHIYDETTGKTSRVTKVGPKSGRTFVIHRYLKDNEKSRRGTPLLARELPELTKLADYQLLELQAAIINAILAMWVEPPEGQDGRPTIPKGISKKVASTTTSGTGAPWTAKIESMDMQHGGVIADQLPAGHKIHSFESKRPTAGFGVFCDHVKRNISSSCNIPESVVEYAFNQSFTGARGELLVYWMTVERYRSNHGWDLCDVILMMWLWGEIDNGKIEAPGWEYEETRQAWSNAAWIGSQRPDIDPLRSVKAHIEEQLHGYKTGQQITAERGGGDYDENLSRMGVELSTLADAIKKYIEISKGSSTAGKQTGQTKQSEKNDDTGGQEGD